MHRLDMTDEEFTEAYLSFRRKVEETIKRYTNLLNVKMFGLKIPVGEAVALTTNYLMNFFSGEGVDPIPRDGSTFTLDPVPFRDMVWSIIEKSKTDEEIIRKQTEKVTDYTKLKEFAKKMIKALATLGVSEDCV